MMMHGTMNVKMVQRIRPITLTRENWSIRRKTHSSATSSNTNLTSTSLGSNPKLPAERSKTLNSKEKNFTHIYEALVGISQKTQSASIMKTNLWKLCRRKIAVCCESGTEDVSWYSCTQLPLYLTQIVAVCLESSSGQTMKSIKIVDFIHKNNGEEIYDSKGCGNVKAFRWLCANL
jgi:hypothetical protein